MPTEADLHAWFPQLANWAWEITSPIDERYNCIAWAAGDSTRLWWPAPQEASGYWWPEGLPRVESLDNFVDAFATLGYETCATAELEDGLEKVIIYATDAGKPTHAARQLSDGTWASKLGPQWDIVHEDPEGVAGRHYGSAKVVLRRTR